MVAFLNGTDALANLETAGPDVLISDIGLPDIDGYELIKQIRSRDAAHGGAVPAVAITAYARPRDRTNALLAGFQSYIAKPVDSDELVAVLRSLCQRVTPPSPKLES